MHKKILILIFVILSFRHAPLVAATTNPLQSYESKWISAGVSAHYEIPESVYNLACQQSNSINEVTVNDLSLKDASNVIKFKAYLKIIKDSYEWQKIPFPIDFFRPARSDLDDFAKAFPIKDLASLKEYCKIVEEKSALIEQKSDHIKSLTKTGELPSFKLLRALKEEYFYYDKDYNSDYKLEQIAQNAISIARQNNHPDAEKMQTFLDKRAEESLSISFYFHDLCDAIDKAMDVQKAKETKDDSDLYDAKIEAKLSYIFLKNERSTNFIEDCKLENEAKSKQLTRMIIDWAKTPEIRTKLADDESDIGKRRDMLVYQIFKSQSVKDQVEAFNIISKTMKQDIRPTLLDLKSRSVGWLPKASDRRDYSISDVKFEVTDTLEAEGKLGTYHDGRAAFSETMTRAAATAVFAHESFPGHHFQHHVTSATNNDPSFFNIVESYLPPEIRKSYIEGWAEYATGLVISDNFYQGEDSLDVSIDLLTDQVIRLDASARLVHTLTQNDDRLMISYSDYNVGGLGLGSVRTKPSEYIRVLPYGAGRRFITKLRMESENRLGSKFRLQSFNDFILEYALGPLPAMQELTNLWVERQLQSR